MDVPSFATDDARWNAIAYKNEWADGAFVYAVRTTGVYCRPGCASRRPRRVNVRFFTSWQDAERAGFRACRRCRPNAGGLLKPARAAAIRACRLIDDADEPPKLNDLAKAVGLSPCYLHRIFRAVIGVTPKSYAHAKRQRRLKEQLQCSESVTAAIYDAGFGSSSRCYESATATLGMSPSRYKTGAAGETIRYAVAECYLGHVLVAATARGICVIDLGDSAADLRARLLARFPKAELVPNDTGFAACITQVVTFLEAPQAGLPLPLDIQGTAFQQRVWQALRAIPPGTTTTYAELASRIGSPRAVRAAACACAQNPLAVAVPCHRVLGANGDLRGYRWGPERKRALLEREALPSHGNA
jgi:AraC family transcriptional regulator of adaptative response/methylated-DNA-[protein]-cysteine methyltransferase